MGGREGIGAYALSVGCVSLGLCAVTIVHRSLHSEQAQAVSDEPLLVCLATPGASACSVSALAAIFLMLWWAAGACTLTFYSPFPNPGNGYFACWVAFCCTV